MPKSLAEAANEEFDSIASERDSYEERNNQVRGSDIEASLPDGVDAEAYSHKVIKREGMHRGTANGGDGRRGELIKRGGKRPD